MAQKITINRVEVAKRMGELFSCWRQESRVLDDDIACSDHWNETEEQYELSLTRPQYGYCKYGQCISFSIGEIEDIVSLLTRSPKAVKVHCVHSGSFENAKEEIVIVVEKNILREDIIIKEKDMLKSAAPM